MRISRRNLLTLPACLLILGCESPVESPPLATFRVMAPDGVHLIVGFPDALNPLIDKTGLGVWSADGTPFAVTAADVDSLSATLLTITVSPAYSLRTPLLVRLSGLRYERGIDVSEKPIELGVAPGLRYDRDMAPVFAARCNSCHNQTLASGNYRTDSRAALYAFGSDEADLNRSPDLIAGNDRCQLAAKTAFTGREYRRAGLTAFESDLVREWILHGDASDPPISGPADQVTTQTADFTHVRVEFHTRPDSADASDTSRYHLVDLDSPELPHAPAAAALSSDLGRIVTLSFPEQKLFHHYRLSVDGMNDPYGNRLFDSAASEYRALLTYVDDLAPLFAQSCNRCHGSDLPDSVHGFYRTDSYASLYAYGSDSTSAIRYRNLIPTDSICRLIIKTRQGGGKTGLCALRAPLSLLESHRIADWAVTYFARER
ncbi:MAG: hypothetical protein HY304_08055 [candidate division Zixibacteria bacterium]|nr:hypothetical protein [candidate division Zixibacteria bacterium]